MPLVTFEKYIREQHGVEFRSGQGKDVQLRRGGSVWRSYEDDVLCSVTGALVLQLRQLYPEADGLQSSPLVQVVRGGGVDSVLDQHSLQAVCDEYLIIEGAVEQLGPDTVASLHDITDSLADEVIPKVTKYRAAELLHDLAVRARFDKLELVTGDILPDCEEGDFMDVWLGIKEGYSLKMPGGRKLTKAMVNHFLEIHPDAVLSEDQTALRLGGSVVRLSSVLGLKPFEDGFFELTLEGSPPTKPSQEAAATGFLDQPSRAQVPTTGDGREVEGAQAGIAHVIRYLDVDVNNLPRQEREIYTYGFEGAKRYIDALSPRKRKDLFKYLPIGEYRDVEVITSVASQLKLYIRKAELTEQQWALMAGSRVLVQKGGWDINVDGEWSRLQGPV